MLRPRRCALLRFDASRLAAVLAGGRTLRLQGDSTMRQLFGAIACSVPLAMVQPPDTTPWPLQAKHDNIQRLELVGGGRVVLSSFPDGASWFRTQRGKGAFHAGQMAKHLFGACPTNDVCVVRPTLHQINEPLELEALANAEFHAALQPYATRGGAHGWSIALSPTVQHFNHLDDTAKADAAVADCTAGQPSGQSAGSGSV